jgi:hypothetical protein
MNDQNTEFTTEEDAIIRAKLGEIYAVPADPAYWADLQVRVLARIADSDPGLWWLFLGRWARAGIVAAAVALMIAGIASVVTSEAENRLAYRSVMEERVLLTTYEKVSTTGGISTGDAALRYVLSIPEGPGR